MRQAANDHTSQPASSARRGEEAVRIAAILRDEIIRGVHGQGTKLLQDGLAERFCVSRIPVRDALRQLESEGLAVTRPNSGARVAPASVEDLREINEMRVATETLALRTAMPHLSNAQIDRAASVQTELEAAPLRRFGELNNLFHLTLYEPCRRPRLLAHIKTLGYAADRYLQMTVSRLGYAPVSHSEHYELLDACKQRNTSAALDCLTRHIERAGKALGDHLVETEEADQGAADLRGSAG